MSRKKEQALQEPLTSNDDFVTAINQPGTLYVIDAYQKWTGPCKSICSTLKRMKLECSSARLKFATACIDDLDSLAPHRDMPPEPLFLFYASGVLIDICQGCNVPLLNQKIQTQIVNEDNIEEGLQERKAYVVDRPGSSHTTLSDDNSLTAVGSKDAKQLTFAFITPMYIEHTEAIKAKLEAAGIEVLADRQHKIEKNELVHIFPDILDQDKFVSGDMFIDYIMSGTSVIFVLTREGEHGIGVIDQCLEFIGPSDQETALVEAPDSANALYGNTCMWAAIDAPMANRAINLLFEGFGAPAISQRASAVNAAAEIKNIYSIFGPCTDEFVVSIQNYGCQILQEPSEEAAVLAGSAEEIPHDLREYAQYRMVIASSKSLDSMTAFAESTGEEGVCVIQQPRKDSGCKRRKSRLESALGSLLDLQSFGSIDTDDQGRVKVDDDDSDDEQPGRRSSVGRSSQSRRPSQSPRRSVAGSESGGERRKSSFKDVARKSLLANQRY